MTSSPALSPLSPDDLYSEQQRFGIDWLKQPEHERAYLADPPGFGKTRQLLAATDGWPLIVVAPAAIRNTEIWPQEAELIGWDGHLEVISYHQLARGLPQLRGHLVFDEATHLKGHPTGVRRVGWATNAIELAAQSRTVWLASGTPIPNMAHEIWAPMRLIDPSRPAFWPWVRSWFIVYADRYSQWNISPHLVRCLPGHCYDRPDGQPDRRDCEHWDEFYRRNVEHWWLRRPETLLDLPPLIGANQPLWTPMKPKQLKAYRDLKRDLLAQIPDEGITIEAMTTSDRWVKMALCSTALGAVDLDADPEDKSSGKMDALVEYVSGRTVPSVVACYYRNSALVAKRVLDRLGVRVGMFGAHTSASGQKEVVRAFQAGELDVMVASVSMIKEGLNLQAGDQVVMVERHDRPDYNMQVIRRLRRRGQTRTVTVRQLVTPHSTDHPRQWNRLVGKVSHVRQVITRAEADAML